MALNKKSVVIYTDLIHTFEELKDAEAGKLIKHFFRYVNDMNPEPPDKLTKIAFEPIKQQLKRDLQKWESIIEKRSNAGKISAENKKRNSTHSTHVESVQQTSTHSTVSVNDNVNVSVNVINKDILLEKESKENLVDIDKNILEQNLTAEKIDSNPPTPFTSKGQKKEKMKFEPNFDFCENSPLKEVLKRWLKYKEWKGQRYKGQDSIETMFKKLNEYSRGDPGVALEIIEDAIARNYSGFFKPNEQTQKTTQKTTQKNGINEKSTGDKGKERTYGGFSEPAIKKFFRGE